MATLRCGPCGGAVGGSLDQCRKTALFRPWRGRVILDSPKESFWESKTPKTDEAYRRRIGRQLNKGEAVNWLRRFLAYAHAGTVRHRHHEDQLMQADCLTIVTNACILSTTWYEQDAIEAREAAGHTVSDEAKLQLSFAHFEAINPYGSHNIDVAAILERGGRRPLRRIR